ncbi:VOC family protein [Leuconostoc lactis]|uniref:VOC family protein n=1 Tax=Leuconostoc lactis TaxID=1246 RepID=UPI0024ADAAD3|nr:VOC family protein [Leuconostoc lactis]MDI6574116.1 VOC family protein [Leuconostoc lactis]
MQPITYHMTHLTLVANDEAQMRPFYRDILGFVETKIDAQTYSYALTTTQPPILTLVFNGTAPSAPRQGLYHFALLFPDTASLASLVAHLLKINYPLGGGDHDVSEAFYLNDPNGNGIELYHDRPREQWQWDQNFVQMGTKAVDVATLLQARKSNWVGFPSQTTIGHLHFLGHNVAAGDAFFIDGLGMALTTTFANSANFYSHNRYHHHHAYNTWLGAQVAQRQPQENGLTDWTVAVNPAYFAQLKTRFADRGQLIDVHTLIVIDPFGSTLIIHETADEA